jgi:tripartite-type tricarboxylate transporter receptor subunit TctC
MKFPRRGFLHLATGAAALPALSRIASAQAYPTRPARLVVPTSPGGGADLVARLVGQWLTDRLGQQFFVDNRGGGGGNIATEAVVRAVPDGYTLLWVNTTNAINPALYEKLRFVFVRDIVPVASVISIPNVLLVHPSNPSRTIFELIGHAKANPGRISMGSPGVGSSSHLSGELLKAMTGVNMLHVPYRGGAPAMTDLLSGQIQILFVTLPACIGFVREGSLRALAVTSATRTPAAPEIPALAEFVPGYEATTWWGVGAPRNTPAEIIASLNKEINSALADTKFTARLSDMGGTPLIGSPADFGKLIAQETDKWGKVVKFAGVKPE